MYLHFSMLPLICKHSILNVNITVTMQQYRFVKNLTVSHHLALTFWHSAGFVSWRKIFLLYFHPSTFLPFLCPIPFIFLSSFSNMPFHLFLCLSYHAPPLSSPSLLYDENVPPIPFLPFLYPIHTFISSLPFSSIPFPHISFLHTIIIPAPFLPAAW